MSAAVLWAAITLYAIVPFVASSLETLPYFCAKAAGSVTSSVPSTR